MPESTTEKIISLITRADQGELIEEADAELRKLCEAVARNGGKGAIKITIDVKEIKGKDAVEVSVDCDTKMPKPARMSKPYFLTDNCELTRKHGAQPDLPGTGLESDETVDADGVVTKLRK